MQPPALAEQMPLAAGAREMPVDFAHEATTLKGILTTPADPSDLGIVFVHGWSGNRCGPHGILTRLARAAAEAGYPSLRFDFRGRGESEGNGLDASLISMADDVVAAGQVLTSRGAVRRIIYVGLCSGGNVTIGSLKRLPTAAGLVLLSVYPFSDGDAFGRDVHRTWHYARVYWRKATQRETWRRLFRGDVHVFQVVNVLFGHFLKSGASRKKEEGDGAASSDTTGKSPKAIGKIAAPTRQESRKETGEAPRKYLANLRKDLPALMVYGSTDPDAPAAIRYFKEYAEENKLPLQFVTIEGANHNFSSLDWKEQIAEMTVTFLRDLPPA